MNNFIYILRQLHVEYSFGEQIVMAAPQELSLSEIRDFMLNNGGKVTNHALVKYFKKFLTNPNTQGKEY